MLKQTVIDGYIAPSVSVNGKLNFDGILRIDGKFKGEIEAKGILIVGRDGLLESDIKIDTAIVAGEIRGKIEAVTKVEIIKTGKVYGDIKTKDLMMDEGALFEGNCLMRGK